MVNLENNSSGDSANPVLDKKTTIEVVWRFGKKRESKFKEYLERNKEKFKLFFEADLEPALSGGYKYHIHTDRYVPLRVIGLWKKRGYRPLRIGVAHVRFEDSDKKYTFPAFFGVISPE